MSEDQANQVTNNTTPRMSDTEIFIEVEAQIDALQEIAAELNGNIRPEITIRMRPNLSWWMGCQCGTKFISASGPCFFDAHNGFFAALQAARREPITK